MAEAYAFTARGLAVGYRGKPLIRDIGFRLPKGKILTLIGPNGAGKSTILKTITRQLAAIAGTALIEGKEISRFSQGEMAKKMSVLLTERVRPEMMTCFDVAAMGRYPHTGRFGKLSEKDVEIVWSTLRRVRAEEIADRDFSQISDGQRQRVLLARALCQEPEILVLDEPTAALDPIAEAEIYAQLNQIVDDRTAIYISHRLSSCRFCDEILVFDQGQVVQRGSHEALLGDGAGKYSALWNAQAQYYAGT